MVRDTGAVVRSAVVRRAVVRRAVAQDVGVAVGLLAVEPQGVERIHAQRGGIGCPGPDLDLQLGAGGAHVGERRSHHLEIPGLDAILHPGARDSQDQPWSVTG